MISPDYEALPVSLMQNTARTHLTDKRTRAVPAGRTVGLRHIGTAAGNALVAARVLRVVGCAAVLIALAMIALSLTSCAPSDDNAFLGSAYDGPTAAYAYNHP
jgi:hypothetical protein